MNLDAHYKVLGLEPGSPLALIKKTYLREIKIWHPDRYAPNSSLREAAEERTKALTAAYAALNASLGGTRTNGAHPDAKAKGRGKTNGPAPHSGPTGWRWLEQLWRHLRQQRPARPAEAESVAADRHSGKSAANRRAKPRKPSTFNHVHDEACGQSKSGTDSAAAWRRLVAKRARYRSRRGGTGATAIDPVSPRGPVTPVRPVRPIGEDG